MMNSQEKRIDWLVSQREFLAPWLGDFSRERLTAYLCEQLGSATILEGWEARGDTICRAFPYSPLLHVLSGNAPHAAFQSVFRGLLLGAKNWVKLPRGGVREFEAWAETWPSEVRASVEIREILPEEWLRDCEAAVVFGEDATLAFFREKLGEKPMISHGQQVGVAWVESAQPDLLDALCGDIFAFEQKGCLSVQTVCVQGDGGMVEEVARGLAAAMERARGGAWRREDVPSFSESGAIFQTREMTKFSLANGLLQGGIWQSDASCEWTVILRAETDLQLGEGNGVVRVQPAPKRIEEWGEWREKVGVLVVENLIAQPEEFFSRIRVKRFAEVGRAQFPPFSWHHGGRNPLQELVKWVDRV